ncbi:MAG TPA: hypothetical protein PKZ89_07700, partial [Alphaproteobacteria bacterium]|nr:hypothetical protein [Alphaproteobacteria bacterium]
AALREAGQSASSEIQSAESDAKTRLADAIAGFRDRYEKEIGDAENRIQKATDIALQDMNSLVATLATQMAEKVAGISADATQAETVVRSLSNKASKAA